MVYEVKISKVKDDKKAEAAAEERARLVREREEVVKAVQALLRGLQNLEDQVHRLEERGGAAPARNWWGRRDVPAGAPVAAPSASSEAAEAVHLLASH